jgi:DNA helicase-2/ATP-dependent DNA helicase PcrA
MSNIFLNSYQKLNLEQKKAVDCIDGPVMAVAGPGTGKTQILALRVVNILRMTDTLPQNILCLTFTDSARENLQQRLVSFIGKEAYQVKIHTFHSLSIEIMSDFMGYFFDSADFKPMEEIKQLEILNQIFENLEYSNQLKKYHPEEGWIYRKEVINKIKELKKNAISPQDFENILQENKKQILEVNQIFANFFETNKKLTKKNLNILTELLAKIQTLNQFKKQTFETNENLKSWLEVFLEKLKLAINQSLEAESSKSFTTFRNIYFSKDDFNNFILKDCKNLQKMQDFALFYTKYQEALYQNLFYDFEDMILQVLMAIKKHPDLKYSLQEKSQYLLIDEFQDTNLAQLELAESLLNLKVSEGLPNIFIVGDDDQSIYKFQGANLENLLSFKSKYKKVEQVFLTKNYRSKQEILDFAKEIIDQSDLRLSNILGVKKELIAN